MLPGIGAARAARSFVAITTPRGICAPDFRFSHRHAGLLRWLDAKFLQSFDTSLIGSDHFRQIAFSSMRNHQMAIRRLGLLPRRDPLLPPLQNFRPPAGLLQRIQQTAHFAAHRQPANARAPEQPIRHKSLAAVRRRSWTVQLSIPRRKHLPEPYVARPHRASDPPRRRTRCSDRPHADRLQRRQLAAPCGSATVHVGDNPGRSLRLIRATVGRRASRVDTKCPHSRSGRQTATALNAMRG